MLLLYATSVHGVGVSRDSVAYLSAAANIARLHRVAIDIYPGPPIPLTLWPPFYPFLLSFLHTATDDMVQRVRILNAVLFAFYIVGIEWLVLRSTKGSYVTAVLAGLFASLSYSVLVAYARVWSETPFFVLMVFGILALGMHLERPNTLALVFSAGCVALAVITRYVGIVFLPTGFLAIMFWSQQRMHIRIRDAIVFSCIAIAPFSVIAAQNYLSRGDTAGRSFGLSSLPPVEWWYIGYGDAAAWLIPAASGAILQPASVAMAVMLALCASFFALPMSMRSSEGSRNWVYPSVLLLYIALYFPSFLAFALITLRPDLNGRTLLPVLTALVVVAAYAGHQAVLRYPHKRALPTVILLVSVLMITFQLMRSTKWALAAHSAGLHYNNQAWKESAVIDQVRNLPERVQVYSNNPPLIYFLTGRQVGLLGEQTCDTDCSQVASELDALLHNGSVLVWVPAFDAAQCSACLKPAATELGVGLVAQDDDFELYQGVAVE